MTRLKIEARHRHASELLDLLVDAGPLTSNQCCEKLGWTRGRFSNALRTARDHVCPAVGITIPQPVPEKGWRYEATTDWEPVEAGASYALGHIESRLGSVNRDVRTILPHLQRGSKEWRRANFLAKHLDHICSTLGEIANG